MVVQTEIIKEKIPEALLAPCPKRWNRKGGPQTTEDFVVRGDINEDGLRRCTSQLEGIRQWNSGQD